MHYPFIQNHKEWQQTEGDTKAAGGREGKQPISPRSSKSTEREDEEFSQG